MTSTQSQTHPHDQFWLDNPTVLISNTNLLVSSCNSLNENLNALTRVLLIVVAFMFYGKNKNWINVLIGGLIAIVLIKILSSRKEGFSNYEYARHEVPVTSQVPFYAEEWQSPPPVYDEYTNAVNTTNIDNLCEDTPKVFGQYVTNPRALPHQAQQLGTKSLDASKLYMNDEFANDSLTYRNSMISNYLNSMNSWYRGGGYDQISPYSGY